MIFAGYEFVLSALLPGASAIRKIITTHGGSVAFSLTNATTYFVADAKEIASGSYSTREATNKGATVVASDFVQRCVAANRVLDGDDARTEDQRPAKRARRDEAVGGAASTSAAAAATTNDGGDAADTPQNDPMDVLPSTEAAADAFGDSLRSQPWRSARVFISSTFRDMHGERDYLTRHVFPELQERCKRLKVHVTPVDLRWGLTEEETDTALEICLSEVDSCRPFFLGLIGERYGWVSQSGYRVPDQARFDWVRGMPAGLSITALEMHYGALNPPKPMRAVVCLRDPSFMRSVSYDCLRDFESENDVAKVQVASLKEQIREAGRAGRVTVIDNFAASWAGITDGKPATGGLEEFGNQVLNYLWSAMQSEFPVSQVVESPLAKDRSFHEAYADNHARMFVGRRDLLSQIQSFAAQSTNGNHAPIVIAGEPGSGKTSLVAAYVVEANKVESTCVLSHFVGAAPGSTTLRALLRRLCMEIVEHVGIEDEVPADLASLKLGFPAFLTSASEALVNRTARGHHAKYTHLTVVIDAINQLSDNLTLEWLPRTLPRNVNVVVSSLPGKWLDKLVEHVAHMQTVVHVGPLNMADRRAIVTSTLHEYSKKLDDAQMSALLAKEDAVKPLYLIVACEELRVFGVYEHVTRRIQSMAGTVPALFAEVLARLETDHGPDLVGSALSLLATSRSGLSEDEMLILLAEHGPRGSARLPQATWARLNRALEAFLRGSGEASGVPLLDFFHRQLAKAVTLRYLGSTESGERSERFYTIHRSLGEYFVRCADPSGAGSFRGGSVRGYSEAPYHCLVARLWRELEGMLCDLGFVEAKAAAGLAYDLVADYLVVFADMEEADNAQKVAAEYQHMPWLPPRKLPIESLEHVREYFQFVRTRAHHLHLRPNLTFSAAVSQPDASRVATAAMRRWNTGEEKRSFWKWRNKPQEPQSCLMTLSGHEMVVRVSRFSHDQKHIISCSDDKTARIWDADTGGEVSVLKGHKMSIMACDMSPDGGYIVTGCWDKTLKLWNANSGAELQTMTGHRGTVMDCCFSPNGEFIASCSRDKMIMLWRFADGMYHNHSSFAGHQGAVNGVAFSPDGSQLASVGADRLVMVWQTMRSSAAPVTLNGHHKAVNRVQFSPDGKLLVSAADDRNCIIWDLATQARVATCVGHKDGVVGVAFSPNGQRLASVSHDNLVLMWNLKGEQTGVLAGHTGSVFDVRFSKDGRKLVTCSFDRSVKVWDVTGKLEALPGHTARILDLAYSDDGRTLVTASRDKTLKLWDTKMSSELRSLEGHASNVFGCAYSSNLVNVASASRDGTLKVWEVKTGECVSTLSGHTGMVYAVAYSPDGRMLVSGGEDKLVGLWDVSSGARRATLFGHREQVRCVCVSPDGKKIATGADDNTLKLWDTSKGRKLATFSGHTKAVICCTFSPDSKRVLSGSDDYTLREWNAENAKPVAVMRGHTAAVTGCGYSIDGRVIISGGTDSLVISWDAATHEELVSFACLSRVTSLAVSPSGDDMGEIAVGDGSGCMYLLLPIAGGSGGRVVTTEEERAKGDAMQM